MNNNNNGSRHPGQSNRPQTPQRPAGQPYPQNRTPQQKPPYRQGDVRRPGNAYPQHRPPNGPYPPVQHTSRRRSQRTTGLLVLTVIILVMLLMAIIIFAARCASGAIGEKPELTGKDSTTPSDVGVGSGDSPAVTDPPVTDPPATEPVTTALDLNYEYAVMREADLHKGYLILVNYQNPYSFDTDFKIQPFYGNRTKSYKLRDTKVSLDATAMDWCNKMMDAFSADTGKHDILVNSAFRDKPEQEAIYAARVDQYGEEYAQKYVSLPGYSEHHTALAIDFTIYTDSGESKTFDQLTDYPKWLTANAHRFGYIQRFPADKTDITKIAYENWHYRYVGKPHAYFMKMNNYCLEEYIEALRGFPFDGKHLNITDDEGAQWEIYFVPSEGETTKVPVPKYQPYTVSGNNVDGFIVTVGAAG